MWTAFSAGTHTSTAPTVSSDARFHAAARSPGASIALTKTADAPATVQASTAPAASPCAYELRIYTSAADTFFGAPFPCAAPTPPLLHRWRPSTNRKANSPTRCSRTSTPQDRSIGVLLSCWPHSVRKLWSARRVSGTVSDIAGAGRFLPNVSQKMGRRGRRGRDTAPFSIARELEAAGDELDRALVDVRTAELREALAAYPDAELRDDSRLAYQFVTGDGDGGGLSAEATAAEMATIQFLYSKTEYGRFMQPDLRRIADWAKHNYPAVSWSEVWTIVRDTMVPACKLEAAKRHLAPAAAP